MRKTFALAALAAAISLPLIAGSTDAQASCQGRKTTGTVLGGLGGALLGNSVSRGGGGAIVGGLGGAVIGHEIAGSGCGNYRRHSYYRNSRSRYAADERRYSSEPRPEPSRRIYYDRYGNPLVGPGPVYNR